MSQYQESELRRSPRTRNRKSFSDYFSDDDVLTEEHDNGEDIEEQEDLEEYQDTSDDEYSEEEEQEASDDSSDNDSGSSKEQEANEASMKGIDHKFACDSKKGDTGREATEPPSNENSSETSSSDRKPTKESTQAKSSSGKKVAPAPRNKKRKAKSSNDILTFNERLRCLQDFKKKYGHVHVPKHCKDLSCHEGLGRWCSTIRWIRGGTYKRFKNPEFQLTTKRMKVLEDMGFRWTTSPTFDEHFHELQAFKKRHGHCLVRKEYKGNKKLGNWCARLRLMKSGTHPNTGVCKLTPERIKRLENLGFRWRMKSQPLKRIDFKKIDFVDQSYRENNIEVGKKKGDSTAANESKPLEVEPAVCKKKDPLASTSKEQASEERIQTKQVSLEEDDSLNQPMGNTTDEIQGFINASVQKRQKRISSPVTNMKEGSECRTGTNTGESRKRKKQKRIRRSFDDHFSALKSFKQKKGHCNVTLYNNKEDPTLANWVYNIRSIKKGRFKPYTSPETKLTKARIEKLDALGFEWTRGPSYHDKIDKFTFEDYVRDLKAYKAKHGDCYVPSKYKDHVKLQRWVSKLRAIRAGTMQPVNHPSLQLTEERIKGIG